MLAEILSHTDGVPLFVEELTKSVLESGLLREAGDQYTLQAPLGRAGHSDLAARFAGGAPGPARAGQGDRADRRLHRAGVLLRTARPHFDAQRRAISQAGLDRLVEAGLVTRRGDPPNASYTFKHALMQDAAYDSLLKSRRNQLHALLAHVLKTEFADRVSHEPEWLAHHYTQAGDLAGGHPALAQGRRARASPGSPCWKRSPISRRAWG